MWGQDLVYGRTGPSTQLERLRWDEGESGHASGATVADGGDTGACGQDSDDEGPVDGPGGRNGVFRWA